MTAPFAKAISSFDFVASRGETASEAHYVGLHSPWARRMLRDTGVVLSYHTAKAVHRFDMGDQFRQHPGRWRYVIIRLDAGRSLGFGPETDAVIAEDHRHFLQNYRSYAVAEDLVLDRRNGQSTFASYLFEFSFPPETATDDRDAAVQRLRTALLAAAPHAYGLRAITLDRVLTEAAVGPIDVEGQRPLRRPLPSTDKAAFVEFLFDQDEWAHEWFRRTDVAAALRSTDFADMIGHRVELACGLDNR